MMKSDAILSSRDTEVTLNIKGICSDKTGPIDPLLAIHRLCVSFLNPISVLSALLRGFMRFAGGMG